MYVFSARPFENHLCERLPCLKIINNNNNNNNNNTSIYERAYDRDSHSHVLLIQAYMSVLMRGILISTLIEAYMSVIMRHQNKEFS